MTLPDRPVMRTSDPEPGSPIVPSRVPSPAGQTRRWQGWLPIMVILIGTVALTLPMVWGGVRLGQDSATQYYPWYENLGERLRAGGVPEWNPHQFSGSPLAGDPQMGWMYLPAMVFFTLLPFSAAVVAQIFGHLLLANLGLWLLARRVGLRGAGALVAGFSFAGSGVLYGRIPSGPTSYQVEAWLPWVLFGAEVALAARTWPVRIAGWALTGLAISQALAAWVGQVSYYIVLLLIAWIIFRVCWGGTEQPASGGGMWAALLAPVRPLSDPARAGRALRTDDPAASGASGPAATAAAEPGGSVTTSVPVNSWRRVGRRLRFGDPSTWTWLTLGRLAVHAIVMLVVGVGLSAAGLLPRLEFYLVSNRSAGEYSTDVGGVIGGSSSESVIGGLFQPSVYYPGASVLALAVIGVLLARGRFGLWFWLVTVVGAIVLTIPIETPLHWLLYQLPQFRALHEHWPERVILIAFPGLALLAGAGTQALLDGSGAGGKLLPRAAAVVLPGALLAGFGVLGAGISPVVVVAVLAIALIAVVALSSRRSSLTRSERDGATGNERFRRFVLPVSLLIVVVGDLMVMTQALAGQAPFGGFHRRDLATYYAPSNAAAFLQERYETEGPFRFAGYDPAIGLVSNGQPILYRYQFAEPITQELVVNNRATTLGLEDSQGFNPLQVAGYFQFITAMNGGSQEYHGADVYPSGLQSPLLDMLNVRYLVVPSAGEDRTDLRALAAWPTVFDDGTVRVVENPGVLPRLWAVSGARTVTEGEALPLLASGAVDPLATALFEHGVGPDAPDLDASEPDAPRPTLTLRDSDDPDTIRFDATAAAETLVVLSEIAYPGWVAEIDGESVDLLTADHTLRAVVVPAGQHTVTLRYDSPATRSGLLITVATLLLTLTAWLVAVRRARAVSSKIPSPSAAGQ